MRPLILILSLALALPLVPGAAQATNHSCNQLRQTVLNRAPASSRTLPYGALPCSAISEIHLLIARRGNMSMGRLADRIEAVFRREGLIR
ncbi:hypothetical protein [Gymnodinialimonas ulvae]|uniref:hypothetical protein n=1 Tax=Gymnodinialimonas ulvae TaxID=3126504 RepID=UPI0030A355BF